MTGTVVDRVSRRNGRATRVRRRSCRCRVPAPETARLLASDRQPGDLLGASVAASGGLLVAGAPFDDDDFNAQGSAYVIRPAKGWEDATEDAKLRASDAATTDRLGSAVAISGDTIVLGAFIDDVGANVDQGSAYVFQSDVWRDTMTETAKLTAADGTVNSSFGYSVAVDGDTVVSGAILHPTNGVTRGAAYVFERPTSGWATTSAFTARLTVAETTTTDRLGESVAIVGDTIVAGTRFRSRREPPGPGRRVRVPPARERLGHHQPVPGEARCVGRRRVGQLRRRGRAERQHHRRRRLGPRVRQRAVSGPGVRVPALTEHRARRFTAVAPRRSLRQCSPPLAGR